MTLRDVEATLEDARIVVSYMGVGMTPERYLESEPGWLIKAMADELRERQEAQDDRR